MVLKSLPKNALAKAYQVKTYYSASVLVDQQDSTNNSANVALPHSTFSLFHKQIRVGNRYHKVNNNQFIGPIRLPHRPCGAAANQVQG
jgi:hypothetical protein